MSISVIVDRLPTDLNESQLADLFRPFGTIHAVQIMRAGIQSLAFGFVELENEGQALNAVASLNGKQVHGRAITVAIVRDQTSKT